MKKKNTAGLTRNIMKILMAIPAVFSLTANLLYHLRFEALLMRKQIICFLVLALFFFILLWSVWLCIISLFVVILLSLQVSMMVTVTLALIFNFLLLMIVSLILMHLKIDPSFPETRKVIKELMAS